MSQYGVDTSKASSPGRPRHQITRSISEISSPIHLHRHHSHRVIRDRERDALSPTAQSATPLQRASPQPFEVSKSAGGTPNISPNPSRRPSVLYASADEVMPASHAPPSSHAPTLVSTSAPASIRKSTAEIDLVKEQQKAAARNSGLQRSLTELETFASTTTRRLDETYYSVEEKLGALQSTIAALKELTELSNQLNNSFSAEADELVTDVTSQLDAFGSFDDQQQRIESLQNRINAGRESIKSLSERVDMVRARIEGWERADREWREAVRKRLTALWVVVSTIGLVLILLLISAPYVREKPGEPTTGVGNGNLKQLADTGSDEAGKMNQWGSESAATSLQRERMGLNWTETSEISSRATEMLRAFDEL
ncbi:hypothetical protein B0T21DRAFT_370197 [Apiosordaria backusii]|uniref:Uncharacterized protein n=1 Tax=Apiosordaria backusii TaxID=314023 RepID=A0AA40B7G9_9PEZI|nr:hypothetical protein B0T21DRAFT_370197 [Apiosordaria backusii]